MREAVDRALEIVSEEQFNEAMKPNSAALIREMYEQVKREFQTKTGTAFSWDLNVASMVREVGDPYDKYFLGAYTMPTLHIHATLASVAHEPDQAQKLKRNRQEAEFALMNATLILILTMRSQNIMFRLDLDEELETCDGDVLDVFLRR